MPKDKYIKRTYKDTEIAYLAGIIDGEGSLTIGNYSANKKTGVLHYQTILSITNSDMNLINWLRSVFGGNSWKYSAKQTPKNSRQAYYRWVATGDLLTHICQLVQPFMIIKSKQVEIMLKMRATYKPHSSIGGKQGTQALSQDIIDFRQQCFYEIRALHCRSGSLVKPN